MGEDALRYMYAVGNASDAVLARVSLTISILLFAYDAAGRPQGRSGGRYGHLRGAGPDRY